MRLYLKIIAYFLALVVPPTMPMAWGEVQAPSLKWQYGGCFSSWCETGWYASAAVADLDGDGAMEVIGSAYSIVVLDGKSGALKWRVSSGHDRSEPNAANVGRTWPGIVVADVNVMLRYTTTMAIFCPDGRSIPLRRNCAPLPWPIWTATGQWRSSWVGPN